MIDKASVIKFFLKELLPQFNWTRNKIALLYVQDRLKKVYGIENLILAKKGLLTENIGHDVFNSQLNLFSSDTFFIDYSDFCFRFFCSQIWEFIKKFFEMNEIHSSELLLVVYKLKTFEYFKVIGGLKVDAAWIFSSFNKVLDFFGSRLEFIRKDEKGNFYRIVGTRLDKDLTTSNLLFNEIKQSLEFKLVNCKLSFVRKVPNLVANALLKPWSSTVDSFNISPFDLARLSEVLDQKEVVSITEFKKCCASVRNRKDYKEYILSLFEILEYQGQGYISSHSGGYSLRKK